MPAAVNSSAVIGESTPLLANGADVVIPQKRDIGRGAADCRRLQLRHEVEETLERVDADVRILITELLDKRAHFVAVGTAQNRPVLDPDFARLCYC